MQHLTLEGVKAAARKAYDEGRLQAQVFPGRSGCRYYLEEDGKCSVCAVGAALSDDTLTNPLFENSAAFGEFSSYADFIQVKPADFITIENIQIAHDAWAATSIQRNELEAEFLKLIEHPKA